MLDVILSSVRIAVASAVGAAIVWVTDWSGLVLPSDLTETLESAAVAFSVALTSLVYYIGVRMLAIRFPWVEGFLGVPRHPVLVPYNEASRAEGILRTHKLHR